MNTTISIGVAVAALCASVVSASADVKVKKQMSGGGLQMVEYVKGKRVRTETNAGALTMVTLQQCDLGRTVQINDAAKKYFVMSGASPATDAAKPAETTPTKGGVVTVTTTITDTGERKQILGMTARHIKTKMVTEPGPNACTPASTMEMEGWYVDLEGFGDGCGAEAASSFSAGMAGGCRDEFRTKTVGTAKLGYPVSLTVNTGAAGAAMTFEVVDIQNTTLDAGLFEIPAGYTEAASFMELMQQR